LRLHFDQDSTQRLCGVFSELPSVKEGLRSGMRVHVPRNQVGEGGVVCSDKDGRLREDGNTYSFSDNYLADCITERGIDQVGGCHSNRYRIASPSGLLARLVRAPFPFLR
jgi:hypothetical protein